MTADKPFRFQTRIRYIDTDASGRIHYTSLFRYFESAEIEFFRQFGIHYTMDREFSLPRVHVECDMMLPIVHDDLLEIDVYLTRLGRSSIKLDFLSFKQGALAAKGAVVIACMDRLTQKGVAIPEDLRARLTPEVRSLPEDLVLSQNR